MTLQLQLSPAEDKGSGCLQYSHIDLNKR